MNNVTRQSLSVLVDNEAGVLSLVTRMFSRKGYNIESLAVGTTDDPAVSRITIEIMADDDHTALLCNQLRKLLAVHSVKLLNPKNSLRRELILLKVQTPTSEICNRMIQIVNIFRASVVDLSPTTMTIAMIGEESKAEAMEALVKEFGILELVRTGMVALERGADTIYEATKEKGLQFTPKYNGKMQIVGQLDASKYPKKRVIKVFVSDGSEEKEIYKYEHTADRKNFVFPELEVEKGKTYYMVEYDVKEDGTETGKTAYIYQIMYSYEKGVHREFLQIIHGIKIYYIMKEKI